MGCEQHFPAWLLSSRKSVLLPIGREVGSHHPRRREPQEAGGSNGRQVGTTGHRWGPWGTSQSYWVRRKPREPGGNPSEQVEALENRWETWETKQESRRTGGQDPLLV